MSTLETFTQDQSNMIHKVLNTGAKQLNKLFPKQLNKLFPHTGILL